MKFRCFSVLCLLILMITFLSGCATVQYTRIFVDDQVQDVISIELQKSELSNSEFTTLANEIDKDCRAYVSAVNKWFKNFEPDGENFTIELYENIKNNIVVQYVGDKGRGKFTIQLTFSSLGYFYLFFGIRGIDGVNENEAFDAILDDIGPFLVNYKTLNKEDFSPFSYKYGRYSSESIFANIKTIKVVGEEDETYFNKYSTLLNDEDLTDEELLNRVLLLEVFGTSDSRLQSNANDGREKGSDGITYHYWDINKMIADKDNSTMEIYYRAPKSATWYIIGLVAAVVAVAVTFVVAKGIAFKDIDEALTLGEDNEEDD